MQQIGLFSVSLEGAEEFKLDTVFLETYKDKQPKWGPVGYITYKRTYARTKEDGTSEEFWETCARVVNGVYQIQQRHCAYYNLYWDLEKAQASAQEMYRRMWEFKFLPPGRGLWMMGTEYVKKRGSGALNNCAMCSTISIDKDFSDPFCFLMDMSMLGVGVSGDTVGAGKVTIEAPWFVDQIHVVEDTREGWVMAMKRVLDAYVHKDTMPSCFDYSKVRPYGSTIKGFGGVAAGPGPLKQLIETDLPSVLDKLIGKPITEEAIVDLFNYIGKCVVSGNIRRSATLMLGDATEEYLNLKNPETNKEALMDRRWASNNSIRATVGMDYTRSSELTAKNGEPGFIWMDNARSFGRSVDGFDDSDSRVIGVNPCSEVNLEDRELCTLVETFPAHHSSYKDYERTLKYAYLYAKTVTLLPTHNAKTNAVMMRNRRLGISQSGIMQSFAKIGKREHFRWCDDGYKYLRSVDTIYSGWLAIPKSIRLTSVKPSGTVSKLANATAGIHFPPSEYYIQRIRFAIGSPLLDSLTSMNYPCEPCKYSPNTMVVEFPVKEANFYKAETDVSLWEQTSNAAQMQRYWADNQVSVTVKFDNSDPVKAAQEIKAVLECFEDQLKGISFLPHAHGYEQAPWEPITKEEYESRIAKIQEIKPITKKSQDTIEKFCDGASCQIQYT